MILKEKDFLKSMILKKNFLSCQIPNQNFFVVSVSKSTFLQRVRFGIENITTRQVLNNLPKSTTCTFQIVFLHITMYSYRLQYLRQLDISIRFRSYNTFCTLFHKDFHF